MTLAAQRLPKMDRILLTGFAPFGRERANPSWTIAHELDGEVISGLRVKTMRLPVNCRRASREIAAAIAKLRPRAVLGLGQAGGRTALSIERVAINLASHRAGELNSLEDGKAIIRDGPDAYFSRIPHTAILRALERQKIPASISLSAGAYACNAMMYSALHALRDQPKIPVGFIHLPYDAGQAVKHPTTASMSIEMMTAAARTAIREIARSTSKASPRKSGARRARTT